MARVQHADLINQLKKDKFSEKIFRFAPIILGLLTNIILILTMPMWGLENDAAKINSALGNYGNVAAFIFVLIVAETMGRQMARLDNINELIAEESSLVRSACIMLGNFPFKNHLTEYYSALKILRYFTFRAIWETMSFSEQLEYAHAYVDIIGKAEYTNPASTVSFVMKSLNSDKESGSRDVHVHHDLVGKYADLVMKIGANRQKRHAKQSLKLPRLMWFILSILMITMFIGVMFVDTGNMIFNLFLCTLINVIIVACLYVIADLQDCQNGSLKCSNHLLWRLINDITNLMDQASETQDKGTFHALGQNKIIAKDYIFRAETLCQMKQMVKSRYSTF